MKICGYINGTGKVPCNTEKSEKTAKSAMTDSFIERIKSLAKEDAQNYTSYIQNHSNWILWILVAVYSDNVSSTRSNQRPSYQKLMRDCTKRKVDLILVKSLSRFSRDALETIRQIRLKRINVGVYIENGGLNTLNISDSMIDQLAALDQAESQFRSTRTWWKMPMNLSLIRRHLNWCRG